MITYNVDGVKMPKIKKRETTAWIKRVAASHGRKVGEIGYMFVDDKKILEVNNDYLGHDYYTDIITFDYDEGDTINGDLVISFDSVRSNAEKFGKDYDEELHRVIIHGILHLCGINDKGPGEREIMEDNENKALALRALRSEEHTSELQSRQYLVCRLLLEKKQKHLHKSRPSYDTVLS